MAATKRERSRPGTNPFAMDTRVSQLHRITVDPEVCGGRPCLRGLRIRVSDILEMLAAGSSHEAVLED